MITPKMLKDGTLFIRMEQLPKDEQEYFEAWCKNNEVHFFITSGRQKVNGVRSIACYLHSDYLKYLQNVKSA